MSQEDCNRLDVYCLWNEIESSQISRTYFSATAPDDTISPTSLRVYVRLRTERAAARTRCSACGASQRRARCAEDLRGVAGAERNLRVTSGESPMPASWVKCGAKDEWKDNDPWALGGREKGETLTGRTAEKRQTNDVRCILTYLEATTQALLDAVRSTSTHMFLAVAVNPGITYDSIEAAFFDHVYGASNTGGALGIPITDVNNNCSTGSTALVYAGDAHCARALGFERMAPGALGAKPAFPDRPSPVGPLVAVAVRASPDSKRGPLMPCMFGAAAAEYFRKCGGGVEHDLAKIAIELVATGMATDFADVFAGCSAMDTVGYGMTRRLADKIFAQAGASRDDVGAVELHDCFAANELVTYPALELCAVDDAHRFVERGDNTYGGKYVVNPSGGLEAKGHPFGATGLAMHFSITKGTGPMQAPGLFDLADARGKYGLVHNIGLGGAVVVSLFRRPEFYHADSPDGRDRLGYNHAHELRTITRADVDKVRSKSHSEGLLQLAKFSLSVVLMGTHSHSVPLPNFAELLLSIGCPSGGPFSIPSDSSSGAASHIRKIAQGRRKKQKDVRAQGKDYRPDTTINMLPDNVLLEIFDICQETDAMEHVWGWHFFVHVCRRWRQIIFDSPNRLNLRIFCTYGTPVRKNLGIWPALPIVMNYANVDDWTGVLPNDEDNVVAALEHPDRVSYLGFIVTGSQLDKMAAVMQEPFPVLKGLHIHSDDGNGLVLPAKFLGGSAPRLQYIELYGIPFPALPTLLLSASDLVWLHLLNIPPTGYFTPKAMAACLAVLLRLRSIVIEFQSATRRPDQISLPPVTRTVLPALTFFEFMGASEYLEDLVAQIDSPQLDRIGISYLNQLVDFQVGQLSKFVDRSVGPKLTHFGHAQVTFSSDYVSFTMNGHKISPTYDRPVWTTVLCQGIDWQVSHIAQVLSHVSITLSNVVHLKLAVVDTYSGQLEDTDDVDWPHLLHLFTAVQTLHVSQKIASRVAVALEDITGEMAAEVLPTLDLIYLVGLPASSVENFVTARRLSGRPLTVVYTETEFNERLKSYLIK
ncbi:hypothetical protein EDB89DRAFT_1905739 [Lactarius sanguifluus]|nr:hypothetical protein EDB89DRAFT_1905739 [Lactarius sanguifluus]